MDSDRDKENQLAMIAAAAEDEKLRDDIQIYEKRIQGLVEGVGMLKERVNKNILIKKSYFFN
jgi:hypothetical protein